MSKIPIHHYQILIKHGDRRGHTISGKPEDDCHFGTKAIDEEEEDIYTGEFINMGKTEKDNPNLWFLKRKSKDTYVFLKDYKPKIKKLDSEILYLDNHIKYLDLEMKSREKKWNQLTKQLINQLTKPLDIINGILNDLKYGKEEQNKRIEKLEKEKKELNDKVDELAQVVSFHEVDERGWDERIEKLEEQMLNVLNPPLKPELKNPFD